MKALHVGLRGWCAVFVLFAIVAPAAGAPAITIAVNDQPLNVAGLVRNNRVLLPFRALFTALSARVVYDATARSVLAQRDPVSIKITLGSRSAEVNHNRVQLDVTPVLVADRLYVPLRFAAQALGARVDYDAASRKVSVRDAKAIASIYQAPSAPPSVSNFTPYQGQVLTTSYPLISAYIVAHGAPVEHSALRLNVDGRDVSALTSYDGSMLSYTPAQALTNGSHAVEIRGTDVRGVPFSAVWSFTTQAATPQYSAPVPWRSTWHTAATRTIPDSPYDLS